MVFTIVTIIFLPMSFIAAFFAINLEDWGDGRLTINYVSKYMFGIGLAISGLFVAAAFLVDDIADGVRSMLKGAACIFLPKDNHGAKHMDDTDDDDGIHLAQVDGNWHPIPRPPGTAGTSTVNRRSFVDDVVEWKRRGMDSRDRQQPQYDQTRMGLSPIRHGARKLSFGSGGGGGGTNPWTGRPSFDGRRAVARYSGDLERGRDLSRSRIHWESAR